MKVAINILPLQSAHKTRGIGYYTSHLLRSFKQDKSVDVQEFTKLNKVKDANVIHYPWFDLFFHTLPVRRRFPTVVTIHDVMPLVFPQHYLVGLKGKINFALQKIALNSCKYIITDSKTSKEDIVKFLKIAEKKVVVIPLAADPQFEVLQNSSALLHVKRQYNLPDRFLLYVGDANWVKNLPFLINGFRELIDSAACDDVKLVLIGGVFLKDVEGIDHPELESLKQVNKLIKQYGLKNKVIRPGQVTQTQLIAFYNLATIYVQPSIYEGFGLPVLEAFSCGAPVICSNQGSLPEVGGDAAIYFDPSRPKEFIAILREVLADNSLQNKLSKSGLKQAAKFSWKKVMEETKSVYLKVAGHG